MVKIDVLQGKESFDSFLVSNSSEIILVIFSASWCGPCQRFKAYLKSPESEIMFPGLKVAYFDVDVDENGELCEIFEVESLPTYFFSKLDSDNSLKTLPKSVGFSEDDFQKQFNLALKTFFEENKKVDDNSNKEFEESDLSVNVLSNENVISEEIEKIIENDNLEEIEKIIENDNLEEIEKIIENDNLEEIEEELG
jgi:thiol-disulfide isomerase/thioredoxin